MKLMSVTIGKMRSEFSVEGKANIMSGEVKFQGMVNGIPFCQSNDYEETRSQVMEAVEINNHAENKELS